MTRFEQYVQLLLTEPVVFGFVRPALDMFVNEISQFIETNLVAEALHVPAVSQIDFVIVRSIKGDNDISFVQSSVYHEFECGHILVDRPLR